MTGEPIITQLADVALSMHEADSAQATVESVLASIKSAVGADYVGAVLIGPKQSIETVPGSDDLAEQADAIQVRLGEGPDLALVENGALSLMVNDTWDDKRWPAWSEAIAELGLRSVIAVRLSTRDRAFGGLNVFSTRPDAFSEDDRSVIEAFARHVAIAVSSSLNEQHLIAAIDSRKLIGQAQGILMERFSLSDEQAFAVLLRYSQHTNTKLRIVADQIVTERTLPIQPE
ncbi:MAG: GAF and ANTAR domain-containing protein [Aeromicrobium sp.]